MVVSTILDYNGTVSLVAACIAMVLLTRWGWTVYCDQRMYPRPPRFWGGTQADCPECSAHASIRRVELGETYQTFECQQCNCCWWEATD